MKKLLTLTIVLSALLLTFLPAVGLMPAQPGYADANGNTTQGPAEVHVTPTWNRIGTCDFTPNASATLEIYDSKGGNLIFGPQSLLTDDSGSVEWQVDDYGVDLVAGNYFVVTDDETGTTKTLVAIQHTFDLLDIDGDVARGTAPPFTPVVVFIRTPDTDEPYCRLGVEADANGDWVADFGANGCDILPFTSASAAVWDEDSDGTMDNSPWIDANVWRDYHVTPRDFTPNASLTIEVYDAPGGSLLFGPETYLTDTDGCVRPPLDLGAHSVRPIPGNYLVITDNVSTYAKTLIYPDDTVDPIDFVNNLVTGTALPFAPVLVHVKTSSGHYALNAFADENGNWTADFGAMGVDLEWDASAGPWVYDEDGDRVLIPRLPFIQASLTHDWIGYWGFTCFATVTFEVYDSIGGNPVYGPETHDTEGEWIFDLDVDLVPGNHIVATDDVTGRVKELVLLRTSINRFDRELDLVEGTAPPFATVEVDVTGVLPFMTLDRLRVVADGNGFWSADFGAHGFDITEDMNALAAVLDEDYDSTAAQPVPFVTVTISGTFTGDSHTRFTEIVCDPNVSPVTFTGWVEVTGVQPNGAVMFGLVDKAWIETGDTGWGSGAYAYFGRIVPNVRIGPSDGFMGGELNQVGANVLYVADGPNHFDFTMVIYDGLITVTYDGGDYVDNYGDIEDANSYDAYPGSEFDSGAYVGIDSWPTENSVDYEIIISGCIIAGPPPPREVKQVVASGLSALLSTGDKKTDKRINKAIDHIEKSLAPKLWESDSTLTKKGKKVFDAEKKAVKELMKIETPDVSAEIDALVSADESLAQTAIDDAIDAGGDAKKIAKAEKEMAKAQKEYNKGKYDKAIDHYKKAWEHAQKAMK